LPDLLAAPLDISDQDMGAAVRQLLLLAAVASMPPNGDSGDAQLSGTDDGALS